MGGPDGVFVPNGVLAEENDTITFTFVNGSHSVVESNLSVISRIIFQKLLAYFSFS